MAREVRLWEWMREGLRGVGGLHMVRVENMASVGDPDVEGCYRGDYFEVELKGCDRPKRPDSILDFEVRRSQLIYHRERSRCGGNTWLYARVGADRAIRRYLVPGCHVYDVDWPRLTEARLADLAALSGLPPIHSVLELLDRISKRYKS